MMQGFRKIERAASVATTAVVEVEPDYVLPGVTRDYLLGGKALFTVTNRDTGESMTFKVRRARKEWPIKSGDYSNVYFVNVKSGGERFPYRYIGILNPVTGTIKVTAGSAYLPGSKEYTTASWATGVVLNRKLIAPNYSIDHQGKCGTVRQAPAQERRPCTWCAWRL
jgi:hypothetical protein